MAAKTKRPIARPIKMTEEYYQSLTENDEGICLNCGAEKGNCEPDARAYPCDACGAREVYGAEELLTMGEIEFK